MKIDIWDTELLEKDEELMEWMESLRPKLLSKKDGIVYMDGKPILRVDEA